MKLGVYAATPTLPEPGVAVQQWMCEAVVVPTRSANVTGTRIVSRSKSIVTVAKPWPVVLAAGISLLPSSDAD